MDAQSYSSYLPPLAGICSPSEAMRPGLAVEECVKRLKRYHYAFKRLHEIFNARITAEPIYELKMGFSYHAYLCAEHVAGLRQRVAQMREPPLHLDVVPDPHLEMFFDEILAAPITEALVLGLYEKAVPALQAALERHLAETNLLADNPSARVLRFSLLELGDIARFGSRSIASLVDTATREQLANWLQLLDDCLATYGGLDGAHEPVTRTTVRHYSEKPYVYEPRPKRDERFTDPYNMAVNTEAILYHDRFPPQVKILAMFAKRYREVDVPEMMASIITETKDKPWAYYLDMSRQLWDEARHGLMGEVGLVSLGVDLREVPVHFIWSLILNTQLTPLERHSILYYIEQKLMAKIGKRYEWEVAVASENALAKVFQDYDWADEVLHSRIGREWLTSEFKSAQAILKCGEESSRKLVFDWEGWRKQGFAHNHNWWPPLYRMACEHWGVEPDPEVLAFSLPYTEDDYRTIHVLENG